MVHVLLGALSGWGFRATQIGLGFKGRVTGQYYSLTVASGWKVQLYGGCPVHSWESVSPHEGRMFRYL